MTLLIIFLCVAIGFSFYCSVAEAVLLSVTPSYIATLEKDRPKVAARLKELKANIDRPLAAILTLNTIAHTIGAAGVGAQATQEFGNEWLGAVSVIMTLLILVFSEIIPKTIGAVYWRPLSPFISRSVNWLIWVLFPLVWLSEQLTKLLSGGKGYHAMTREELGAMAEIGAEQGILKENESRIFRALIRFPKITVADIMTPRTVVIALPEEMTVEEAFEKHPELPISRIPVFKNKLDEATGFVLKTDLLLAKSRGEDDRTLGEFKRDLHRVLNTESAQTALDRLLNDRLHIAMVVDEYGTVAGLVTLEDVIETLIGLEIVDEQDNEVDMQSFARDRWRERAKKAGLDV